jgi:hypothetical protein
LIRRNNTIRGGRSKGLIGDLGGNIVAYFDWGRGGRSRGIIGDLGGNIVAYFDWGLCQTSNNTTEAYAMWQVIKMAKEKGLRQIVVILGDSRHQTIPLKLMLCGKELRWQKKKVSDKLSSFLAIPSQKKVSHKLSFLVTPCLLLGPFSNVSTLVLIAIYSKE